MELRETRFPGLIVIQPRIFTDPRGYFFESYNKQAFSEAGINQIFVQDNQSRSSYGIIRGLHYQLNPNAQTKLLRVLEGTIWDVAVDLRKNSPTFSKAFTIEISAENQLQILIPRGFAHGFSVLSESATVFYKCDELYKPEAERGIHFNDPILGIDWKIPSQDIIVSEKDASFPALDKVEKNFIFESPIQPAQ